MEIKRYVEIIWRRKWILIVTAIIVPLCAYLMMLVISPIYKSEAKIWVKMNTLQQKYIKEIPDAVGLLQFTSSDNALGTIEEMLNDKASINKVITEMRLTNRKGEKFTPDEFINPYKLSIILHLHTKGYSEENIQDSDVFKITGYAPSPAEAYAITDRITKGFISTYTNMNRDAAEFTGKILLKRLSDVEGRLSDAMIALERYRAKDKVYSSSTLITTLMSEKSALETERDRQVRSLEGAKVDIRNIKDASLIRQDGIKDFIVKLESSTTLDNYKNQLLNFEAEEAKLAVEKTGEHPDIKIHKQEIALVKDRIRQEIAKSFSSQVTGRDSFFDKISGQYLTALFTSIESGVTIKFLNEQINQRDKALNKIPKMDTGYNKLQWNIDNLKTTRDALQANLENTKSADYLDLSNAFTIQPPTLFERAQDNLYFPPKSKKVALAIATFLGLFFGLFLVFFVEYWNSYTPNNKNGIKKSVQDDNSR